MSTTSLPSASSNHLHSLLKRDSTITHTSSTCTNNSTMHHARLERTMSAPNISLAYLASPTSRKRSNLSLPLPEAASSRGKRVSMKQESNASETIVSSNIELYEEKSAIPITQPTQSSSSSSVKPQSPRFTLIDLDENTRALRDLNSTTTFSIPREPPRVFSYPYPGGTITSLNLSHTSSNIVNRETRDPSDEFRKDSRFFWSGFVLTIFMSLFSLLALKLNADLRNNRGCRSRFLYGVTCAFLFQAIVISAASVVLTLNAYGHINV